MGLIDSVKNMLKEEREPFEASLDSVKEEYRTRREDKIQKASRKEERLINESEEILDNLDQALEELKGFSDKDSIKAVEDVAENFYRDRKRLVSDFESGENIEDHLDALNDFIEDFNDVSRKEGAVMKRVEDSSGSLSERIQEVLDHRDEVSDFVETDYSPIYELNEIEDAVNKIKDVEDSIEEKRKELEDLSVEKKHEKISEKEKELEELKSSDKWEESKGLKNSIDDLKQEKNNLKSSISSDVAELERGLKKLLYSIDNSDIEFEGDRKVLEKLKQGDISVDSNGELEEASELVKENSVLEGRQLSKFMDATEKLDDLEDRKDKIKALEEKIEQKNEKLDGFDVDEEINNISVEIERLENELEKEQNRKEEVNTKINSLKEERKNRVERLEAFISEVLDVEATIRAS